MLTERRAIRSATRLESRLPFELLATRASVFEIGQAVFSLERQLENHLSQRRLRQRIAELQLELGEARQNVERLSRQIEPLTSDDASGSAQQEYSLRRIEESIDMAQRYGVPLSCLLVGLRQSDGRAVPDALLARIAGRLKRCVRSTDLLTLFGKDQFLVLSPFHLAQVGCCAGGKRLFAQMTEREAEPGRDANRFGELRASHERASRSDGQGAGSPETSTSHWTPDGVSTDADLRVLLL